MKSNLDINKVKQESINTGMIEIMILFKGISDKINNTIGDPALKDFERIRRQLADMIDTIGDLSGEVGDMIGTMLPVLSEMAIRDDA